MLRKAGIEAVFSSQTTRTIQTAQPPQAAGVEVQTYDPSKPEPMVAKVKALKGGAVLVVGHSNTVPGLVRLFGGAGNGYRGRRIRPGVPASHWRRWRDYDGAAVVAANDLNMGSAGLLGRGR